MRDKHGRRSRGGDGDTGGCRITSLWPWGCGRRRVRDVDLAESPHSLYFRGNDDDTEETVTVRVMMRAPGTHLASPCAAAVAFALGRPPMEIAGRCRVIAPPKVDHGRHGRTRTRG